jgi:hypothetical protein
MYFSVLLWSLVIFASFWGYGEALRRALKRPEFEDLGWGLTAAWGMALILAIGGFLMMISLAKAPILTGMVLAGAAFAFYFISERLTKWTAPAKSPKKSKSKKGISGADAPPAPTQNAVRGYVAALANILVWGLAALAFASSIAWPHQIDPNDDLICYLLLPEKIISTGTLIEPFNFRRAQTLGGHSMLQGLVMIVGGDRAGHVADLGFGKLLLFGLAIGLIPKKSTIFQTLCASLLGLFAVIYVVPRINTMSAYTGSACILALITSMNIALKSKISVQNLLPSALLFVAASTLRPYFGLLAGLILFAFVVVALFSSIENWKQTLHTVLLGLSPCALLICWMVVLFISNQTFYMPPFLGNLNPVFLQTQNPVSLGEYPAMFWRFFSRPEIAGLLVLSCFAVFFRSSFFNKICIALSFCVAGLVVIKMSATTPEEMPRYIVPVLLPAALLSLCFLFKGNRFSRILAAIGIGLVAWFQVGPAGQLLAAQAQSLPGQFQIGAAPLHPDVQESLGTYQREIRKLQDLTPRGSKILLIMDYPYTVDFSRNEACSIDAIGAAGPAGSVPLFNGPEILQDYLKKNGFSFIMCMDFNTALLLYNRNYWMNHPRPEWYYKKVWGPSSLDFMDNIDKIAANGGLIEKKFNIRLIKL